MTKTEFLPIMAFLQTGCGMKESPTPEQVRVYFELLGDLPANRVAAAVKQVLLDHDFPTLPPVGMIRKAAFALLQQSIPGPKAWELFLSAVRKFGYGRRTLYAAGHRVEQDLEKVGLESLPPSVRPKARAFGWRTLCDTPTDKLGIAQTQFLKLYETMAEHEEHSAIMPPDVRELAATLAAAFALETPALALTEAKP